ncbi:hypothetical protein J2I47_24960 [Fibrella sp. HMF5335]|uniref:Uncharacterized protein n=1 Tax=Fibrella rubiginis TaxID=2817060 RepID=A0A939K5S9_9BACT|nr:hypothetical protein [Fibrella rubiginis]MBO0939819.1 hypothetical protein [Fibrella rubiginis]
MIRILLFLVVFTLFSRQSLYAQSRTAKIYFTDGPGRDLITTFDPNKPIRLKVCCPTLVEVDADTLGLLIGGKPVFIPVERGKSYYFRMASNTGLFETTPLEFWLNLSIYSNSNTDKFRHFIISKKVGVIEVTSD